MKTEYEVKFNFDELELAREIFRKEVDMIGNIQVFLHGADEAKRKLNFVINMYHNILNVINDANTAHIGKEKDNED